MDFAYGCMARTPCVHHALPRPMVVLVDAVTHCTRKSVYPRKIVRFPHRMKPGMHNKAIALLRLLRTEYDAAYYVKIDDDVNISKIVRYEQAVLRTRASYYGKCVVGYPLVMKTTLTRVSYAQGGIYVLSNVSIRHVLHKHRSVVSRWDALFQTPMGNRRRLDEDALVGGVLYMANINLTCATIILVHGCKTCDYT